MGTIQAQIVGHPGHRDPAKLTREMISYRFAAAIARTQHEWSRQFPPRAQPLKRLPAGVQVPAWPPYPYYWQVFAGHNTTTTFPLSFSEQELSPKQMATYQ